jgi:hypothetical protein
MIKAIDLTRFRNAEYLQFMKNFATLVDSNDPAALNVVAQLAALVAKNSELEALFKKEQASEITQELIDIDGRRDRAFNGILAVVDGFTYHYEEVKAQAANRLKNNLNLYGAGVARQNYQAETAILTNISNDWETKPELTAAMNLLDLESWKDEMKAANIVFDQKYLARTLEYSEASPENLLLKRTETTQVYFTLRQFIDAFAVTVNTPIYQTVTNQLNALIDQYNTLLNNRQSAADAGTPEEPTTPVTP